MNALLVRIIFIIFVGLISGCGTASVMLVSDPPNADVFIDEHLVGFTPVKLTLKKETHRIRLAKDGCSPVNDYISPIEKDPATLVCLMFPLWQLFADDFKYTFKETYYFQLPPDRGEATIEKLTESK